MVSNKILLSFIYLIIRKYRTISWFLPFTFGHVSSKTQINHENHTVYQEQKSRKQTTWNLPLTLGKNLLFCAGPTLHHNFWTAFIFLLYIPLFVPPRRITHCLYSAQIYSGSTVFASCFCISFKTTINQQSVDEGAQTKILPLKNT